MNYKEIDGDLISLTLEGNFDVIAHGCNCFCTMKSGIAVLMAKTFWCDKFFLEGKNFIGDINKLGQIEYREYNLLKNKEIEYSWKDNEIPNLYVVNAYTQFKYDKKNKPLDYEALTLCMRKINHVFKWKRIGLPKIGAGLAGGVWDINELSTESDKQKFERLHGCNKDIKSIIKTELKDMDVTIINFKK